MDEVDYIVRNAVASVEMEGRHVTEKDRILLARCLRGEISFEDAIESVISSYRSPHE